MKFLEVFMKSEQVVHRFKEKGYKITPQRRAIINALLLAKQPATAGELLQELRDLFPDISLDTVYRNLKLLTDLGLLNQINVKSGETSRFEFSDCPHHHHLVCMQCGASRCLDYCAMEKGGLAAAEEHGFEVVGHVFEIYGYCPGCRGAN
jgi:Fe2+ or Zn2+ uptake regulation protein